MPNFALRLKLDYEGEVVGEKYISDISPSGEVIVHLPSGIVVYTYNLEPAGYLQIGDRKFACCIYHPGSIQGQFYHIFMDDLEF